MPKQIPKIGDVFIVELSNKKYSVGQVVEITPVLMNSMTCVFYNFNIEERNDFKESFLVESNVISCLFVTRDLFNRNNWPRIANHTVSMPENKFPYRNEKRNGWIGAKIIGSGNVVSFLNAYFGLGDWLEMHDKDYYQKFLLPGMSRPMQRPDSI